MTQKLISHQLLRSKRWYYGVRSHMLRFMDTLDFKDLPFIVSYCSVCGCQRSHILVRMLVDSCTFECIHCKENSINGKVKTMKDETNSKENTSNQDASIQKADANKSNIPSIQDILPDGNAFSYPLLDHFLGSREEREAVLESAEILNGSYGESVALKLDGEDFRSNSKAVIGQVKQLLELEAIPVKVNVAQLVGKSGRKYFTLRGKRKEEK